VSGCIHVSAPNKPYKWVGCLHKSLLLLSAAPLLLLAAPLLLSAAPWLLDEWQGSAWLYDGMQAGEMHLL
jgi:hypothetical protein